MQAHVLRGRNPAPRSRAVKVYEYTTPRGDDRIVVNLGGVDHVLTLDLAMELSVRLDTATESVRQRRELAKAALETTKP